MADSKLQLQILAHADTVVFLCCRAPSTTAGMDSIRLGTLVRAGVGWQKAVGILW